MWCLWKRKENQFNNILDVPQLRQQIQSVIMISNKQWIRLMEIGEALGCHQMPERSFFIKGFQFPVCARCTGVIISAILATIVFFRKKLPIWLCISMSSIMLFDWGMQYLKIKESTNSRRLITGLIGGFGYSTLHLYFYYFIFGKLKKIIKR